MPTLIYTEPGFHTFVWPDRVNSIYVECIGGGGGNPRPSPNCAGAGGGAYAAGFVSRPTSGITILRVGARGRVGSEVTNPDSTKGESSYFENVEAGGGLEGAANNGNNGGVPISGSVLYFGGNGGNPSNQTCDEYAQYLGNGGESGNSSGDGADGADNGDGSPGSYPGGGAGGSSGLSPPAAGYDGIVILTWDDPPPIPIHLGGWLRHKTYRYAPYKPGLKR